MLRGSLPVPAQPSAADPSSDATIASAVCFGVSGAVVESQAAHPVLDELVKTPQVRDHHCAPCRHCLERRETKGFAHFSKAGIDEKGRTSRRAYRCAWLGPGDSECLV